MGKYKRGRTQKKDFRHKRPDVWVDKRTKQPNGQWAAPELKSEAFEEFYKAQNVFPEEEWEPFLASMRSTLPTTFRINGAGKFAAALRAKLESGFLSSFEQGDIVVDGEKVQPPRPLPWYPHRLAWQFSFSRTQLRRVDALEALHECIKAETEMGTITRQEAVSMVPPLFLDVQPHHKVLDMCAAPGSKTVQLLEMLHASSGSGVPAGIVVANDADTQRCNMLTHHTRRLCSPNLVVTNHAAQFFPVLPLQPRNGQEHAGALEEGSYYQFDRVLCDVPCSGDGTMRKAPDIWQRWSVSMGNSLHSVQVRITLQGCRLLAVGGRMVYSTCSLNPIEDEAVVAEVLRRTGGAMRLVDCNGALRELRRLPGVKTWRVKDKERWYDTYADAQQAAAKLLPSMFPDDESAAMPLERCMRLLPHHNDTGGFFVAVFEKVAPVCSIDWAALEPPHKGERAKPKEGKGGGRGAGAAVAGAAVERGEAGGDGPSAAEADAPESAEVRAEPAAGDDAPALDAAEVKAEPEAVGDVAAAAAEGAEAEAGAGAEEEEAMTEPEAAEEGTAASGSVAGSLEDVKSLGGSEGGQAWKHGGKYRGVDPVYFLTDEALITNICDYYGFDQTRLPLRGFLLTRALAADSTPKRIYYAAPSARALLDTDSSGKLKISSIGLKALERQKTANAICAYRLLQEGLPLLLPHMRKQVVRLTAPDFERLLAVRGLVVPKEGVPPPDKARFEDEESIASLRTADIGCNACLIKADDCARYGLEAGTEAEGALAAAAPLAVCLWRTPGAGTLLVSKTEGNLMLDRLREAMGIKPEPKPQPKSEASAKPDGSGDAAAGSAEGASGAAAEPANGGEAELAAASRTAEAAREAASAGGTAGGEGGELAAVGEEATVSMGEAAAADGDGAAAGAKRSADEDGEVAPEAKKESRCVVR